MPPLLTYRTLTKPQRRALDRFARSLNLADPVSAWPEIRSENIGGLVKQGLLQSAGVSAAGEPLLRITDEGSRVHEEMWRDGKVPHHPTAAVVRTDDA